MCGKYVVLFPDDAYIRAGQPKQISHGSHLRRNSENGDTFSSLPVFMYYVSYWEPFLFFAFCHNTIIQVKIFRKLNFSRQQKSMINITVSFEIIAVKNAIFDAS